MFSEKYEKLNTYIKNKLYDDNNIIHNNIDIFQLLFDLKNINKHINIYEDIIIKYIKWGDYKLLDDNNIYGLFNISLELSFISIKTSEDINFLSNIFDKEQKVITDSNNKNDKYNYKNLEITLNTSIYEPKLNSLIQIIKDNYIYFDKESINYYINNLDIIKKMLSHFTKNDVKIINEYDKRRIVYFIKLKNELYNDYLEQFSGIISDIDNIYIKNNEYNLLPGYYNVFKINY